MKIRSKLLVLLLVIALVPLVVGAAVHRFSMHRLGGDLASRTRKWFKDWGADLRGAFEDDAAHSLLTQVKDHTRLVRQNKEALQLAVRIQAREAERALTVDPPARPIIYRSEDYDKGEDAPQDFAPSKKHFRPGPDGTPVPIRVSYSEQVYVVAQKDVDRRQVAWDMARLSRMPAVYRLLHEAYPGLMYWQYTALDSGLHSSYPGHGGYEATFDPRERDWYQTAKETGALGWVVMPEVSTKTVALTVVMPVFRPNKVFAGVTAIDVPLESVFKDLQLPANWSTDAEKMLVVFDKTQQEDRRTLPVFVHRAYQQHGEQWQKPVEVVYLASEDEEEFAALLDDVRHKNPNVRKLSYKGKLALWAYGVRDEDDSFPMVIVPYANIIQLADQAEKAVLAKTAEAEAYVEAKTIESLQLAGAGVLVVILAVVAAAFVSSRSVTRPVRRLAEAGKKLAQGDLDQHVDIRTGDELQELGDIFNDTGPKLKERQRMKQSLAVAMQVQQNLLPQEPPQLPGFDIAGRSLYCEETGGDYYDFIDLVDLGPGKLGIAVGDVTGHGIAAALLVASARGVLRSHASRHGSDLGRLFDALNTHLVRDTDDERFMTLFYGVLDAETRSFEWTSGGHDPALWLRRNGAPQPQIDELPNTGLPLGIVDGAAFESSGPITLKSGEILVIGTDGIWEAHNADRDMFGKDRLRELLSAGADSTAQEIYAAVVDAVKQFRATTPQEDDITLVVIKAL